MKYPIGIMDYGIGGIPLVLKVKQAYPELPIVYFSDSGVVPYGKQSLSGLRSRVNKVIEFLYSQGAQHVFVACHSASSVIENHERLTGIRDATISQITEEEKGSIGIIGGGRTIRAGYYRNELKSRGFVVQQRIAQPLSILIEKGDVRSRKVLKVLSQILKPITDVDKLILACTHYSALIDSISEIMNENCLILDPCQTFFDQISTIATDAHQNHEPDRFLTSGDPQLMKFAALSAFNFRTPDISQIEIAWNGEHYRPLSPINGHL